jgi:hypothetical protein
LRQLCGGGRWRGGAGGRGRGRGRVNNSSPHQRRCHHHRLGVDRWGRSEGGGGADKCRRLLESVTRFIDFPPMFTRGRSFVGHLEHLCCADLWLAVHVPAIRTCVFAAELTNAPTCWSTEARTDLERFRSRLDNTDTVPTARFADHFIVPDESIMTVFSDASGKDTLGVGGYRVIVRLLERTPIMVARRTILIHRCHRTGRPAAHGNHFPC